MVWGSRDWDGEIPYNKQMHSKWFYFKTSSKKAQRWRIDYQILKGIFQIFQNGWILLDRFDERENMILETCFLNIWPAKKTDVVHSV